MIRHKIPLFVFVFINYYNPFSVYLTLLINIMFVLFIFIINPKRKIRLNIYVIIITLLILSWAIVVMFLRSSFDVYLLGKYLRVAFSTLFIMILCSQFRISVRQLMSVLTAVFLIHIMSVWAQIFFPQIDIPMAKIFGFSRDTGIISEFTHRKMGITSSYDTASLISVSSMIFFYLQFIVKKKYLYLLIMFISLVTSSVSSRTGMVLGIIFYIILLVIHLCNSKGSQRLMPVFLLLCCMFFTFYTLFPVFMYSTGSSFYEEGYDNGIISTGDYGTTGTLVALTSTHLDAMKEPVLDLFIGFGIDPNMISGRGTDIGYVKLIYHVGIVGLFLIILLYFYVFIKSFLVKKSTITRSDEFALSTFLILYILLIVIMNYKSLEMYSRGSHDLLLILFFVLTNRYSSDDNFGKNSDYLGFVHGQFHGPYLLKG